jgi:hypothetical protein
MHASFKIPYLRSKMPIKHSPPPTQQLLIHPGPLAMQRAPALRPRLLPPNKMHHLDIILKMPIRRLVLITRARRAIVRKAQSMPRLVLIVLIQQPLVRAVETVAACSQGFECVVLCFIWLEEHHTAVEAIGPADIRRCGEWGGEVEELVGCAEGDYVGVDVDNFAELGLVP